MPEFQPRDPDYAEKVRQSFASQTVMTTIGAQLRTVQPGEVQIEMPYRADLTQQNGFLHAGIITTLVDSACGYAALTLMDAASNVLAVEFKINFLSPGRGGRFVAVGQVVKPGRTITVCDGTVMAHDGSASKLIARMQATMIRVDAQPRE